MMFYTTNYPINFRPCKSDCCFRGEISHSESLCLICGLTEGEWDEWRSMDAEERLELMYEVNGRVNYAWMMWEIVAEPTVQ
jgi:predicted Fe-S protein YdhL (DUF1289 family)